MYKGKKIEQRKIKKIYVVPVPVGIASREKKYMPKKTKKMELKKSRAKFVVFCGFFSKNTVKFDFKVDFCDGFEVEDYVNQL